MALKRKVPKTSKPDLVTEMVAVLGQRAQRGRPGSAARSKPVADILKKASQRQLLAAAKKLGITGVAKLGKPDLIKRLLLATRKRRVRKPVKRIAVKRATVAGAAVNGQDPAQIAKFELGAAAANHAEPGQTIPWSYGHDRITGVAVDPDRLFVYWEVTDDGITKARAELGKGAKGAWLNLRVYDTSGRLFDGTNAHGYFDHKIERGDRQWFFHVGKPTSSAFIEVGMKSAEGYFVRILRSGQVDFPRKQTAPWREPEWLTVRAAGGPVEHAGTGSPAGKGGPAHGSGEDWGGVGGGGPAWFGLPGAWGVGGGTAVVAAPAGATILESAAVEEGWQRVQWEEILGEGWSQLRGSVEWQGPLVATTWEAGPFAYPVEIAPPSREEWRGGAMVSSAGGVTRIVNGPWQVVVRNLSGYQERRVVATWEVWKSWVTLAGQESRIFGVGAGAARAVGASGRFAGASDRRWLSGSELRLGGASELFRIGASERMLRGASERMYAGASEKQMGGASERAYAGASENYPGVATAARKA